MYSDYIKLFNKELMNKTVGLLKVRVVTIEDVDKTLCTIHTDRSDIKFFIDPKTSMLTNLTRMRQCLINCSKTVD